MHQVHVNLTCREKCDIMNVNKGRCALMKPVQIVTGRAGQLLPDWKDAVKEAHAAGKPCVCIVP